MNDSIATVYGGKVRVRVCGLCWQENSLLMVNHQGLAPGDFWSPPGGGVDFGESISDTLVREFQEETGLTIKPGRFVFGCEFIDRPLHAIELFFEVHEVTGQLKTGMDPELQIIKNVMFLRFEEIKRKPRHEVHKIFQRIAGPEELMALTGFFTL